MVSKRFAVYEIDLELIGDKIFKSHINDLYSLLFEENLKKLITPYS